MSKYQSGKFRPTNPEKYRGDIDKIQYRSSWELKFMRYCDTYKGIIKWNSEGIKIKYMKPGDKTRPHRYFVDFWVRYKDKDGMVSEKLIEIKPKIQCYPPKTPKRKTKSYWNSKHTYAINQAKWEAAREFAKYNSIEFVVLTEEDLKIK